MLSQKEMDALKQIAKGRRGALRLELRGGHPRAYRTRAPTPPSSPSKTATSRGRKVGDGPSHVVLEQLGQDGQRRGGSVSATSPGHQGREDS